jgi:hypothetical protein
MTTSLWVGKLKDKLYVFDRDLQLVDCPHTFLWDSVSDEMTKFIPEIARKAFRSAQAEEEREDAVERYQRWKAQFAVTWLQEERIYYEARRSSELAPKAEIGLRFTHCYRCKQELISDEDLCDTCGWIKCACGACRCAYIGKLA